MRRAAVRSAERAGDLVPGDGDQPGGGRLGGRQQAEQRGLAGAVRAEEPDDAGAQVEVGRVQRHRAAVLLGDAAQDRRRRVMRDLASGRSDAEPAAPGPATRRASRPAASELADRGRDSPSAPLRTASAPIRQQPARGNGRRRRPAAGSQVSSTSAGRVIASAGSSQVATRGVDARAPGPSAAPAAARRPPRRPCAAGRSRSLLYGVGSAQLAQRVGGVVGARDQQRREQRRDREVGELLPGLASGPPAIANATRRRRRRSPRPSTQVAPRRAARPGRPRERRAGAARGAATSGRACAPSRATRSHTGARLGPAHEARSPRAAVGAACRGGSRRPPGRPGRVGRRRTGAAGRGRRARCAGPGVGHDSPPVPGDELSAQLGLARRASGS